MLTKRERRILESIESQVSAADPEFAARLRGERRRSALRRVATRFARRGAAAAVPVGFVWMLVTLAWSPWFAALGAIGMGGGVLVHARAIGRALQRAAVRLRRATRGDAGPAPG